MEEGLRIEDCQRMRVLDAFVEEGNHLQEVLVP